MIPKEIRMIWIDTKNKDYSEIPDIYKICIMSAVVFNPDYKVILYTNNPLKDYILNEGNIINEPIPEKYLEDIQKYNIGSKYIAHKADFIRYNLLYDLGGIYCDTDIIFIRPLDDLVSQNKIVLAREKNKGVCCANMMFPKEMEMTKEIIEEYKNNYKENDWIYNSQKFLSKMASKYKEDVNILDYEKGFFYPNFREFAMTMFYNKHEINSVEDIYNKFSKNYSHHLWSSNEYGEILKKYINKNCVPYISEPDKIQDKSYISQLIKFIIKEYNKIGEK